MIDNVAIFAFSFNIKLFPKYIKKTKRRVFFQGDWGINT